MSQHPSLRSGDKQKRHRSVLKRYERIKALQEKEKWQDGDSVFGLPKLKVVRFKIKKEKAPEAEAAAAAAEAAGAEAPAAAGAKPAQAKAKEAAGKKEEPKSGKG